MSNNTKKICFTGIGIALYVCLSMAFKIPFIGHIALDLGYVVLAVYCYTFGCWSGAIIGGAGCVLVSMLTSGMFPPGWLLGNALIGFLCGRLYRHGCVVRNVLVSVATCFLGIFVIKTAVECAMFGIPLAAKIPNNGIAFAADAITMVIGSMIVLSIPKVKGVH